MDPLVTRQRFITDASPAEPYDLRSFGGRMIRSGPVIRAPQSKQHRSGSGLLAEFLHVLHGVRPEVFGIARPPLPARADRRAATRSRAANSATAPASSQAGLPSSAGIREKSAEAKPRASKKLTAPRHRQK